MRIVLILFLLFSFTWGCAKPYKEGDPLTGEDLALAKKATEMNKKVQDLDEKAPTAFGESWRKFVENVRMFENSCQRHRCISLEARNDFNHLRYYAVQLDSIITQQAHPNLYNAWNEIRENYVDAIGKELGYRIE